jgi:hypothetical protein
MSFQQSKYCTANSNIICRSNECPQTELLMFCALFQRRIEQLHSYYAYYPIIANHRDRKNRTMMFCAIFQPRIEQLYSYYSTYHPPINNRSDTRTYLKYHQLRNITIYHIALRMNPHHKTYAVIKERNDDVRIQA